jgi:hypothetical protein
MATPVHLVAGMASVHLDIRGVLHLGADDQATLAADFRRVFHDSGFALEPLSTGDFLLFGPPMQVGDGAEPARFLGESVAEARKGAASDPVLRRLSAEIEMWLHEHAVNDARAHRGEPPVTGLWLWGGGPAAVDGGTLSTLAAGESTVDIAFGRDAYLSGLLASVGRPLLSLPQQLRDVLSYSHAQRAVVVIELAPMLHSAPRWTFIDVLAHIDRDFILPAVKAMRSGELEQLTLLANDRQLTLGRHGHLKLWRRAPAALLGLQ